MDQVISSPKLASLVPVVKELKALRQHLLGFGADQGGRPIYVHAVGWIDEALQHVEPHLQGKKWPPIWWRLRGMNVELVARNFVRADSDGYFRSEAGYVPERSEILAWVARIDKMYKQALAQR